MQQFSTGWVTFLLAVAAAMALSFLLSGCASSHREPVSGAAAADSWGSCDRSRMISVMLVCRQTKPEPVSDLSR